MSGNRSELVERLWGLHRRGLSYASDKPAVNLLLADLSEGIADAARALAAPSQPLSDNVVERVARAMKSWKFAKSPCLDGFRICGVVDEGDHTSFPSKTFKTIAEAQAALDDLNARAAIAAIPSAGGVEEWRNRCEHLLSCIDSCNEAGAPPEELDREDVALIEETRAALGGGQ
jgi:hypothetical protein